MAADPELKAQVEQILAENPVLLFMKGTPEAPRCGFSMRVVQVLEALGVEYGAIDVLPALQPLREVTQEISDWPTFPQLYAKGELVGGCDIVEEMLDSGELAPRYSVSKTRTPRSPRPSASFPAARRRARRCNSAESSDHHTTKRRARVSCRASWLASTKTPR